MDNNSSYEPFEPDRVTPVGRTPAAGQQPPGAPQRGHPHIFLLFLLGSSLAWLVVARSPAVKRRQALAISSLRAPPRI